MNRSIFIRLFSAIWLFSIAQEGFSQDLLWKVGVYNLFDNSEFDRSDIRASRTMTSTQLQPLIGLGIEEKHRIMAGVDLVKEWGSKRLLDNVVPIAYYQYFTPRLEFLVGAFPKRRLLERYPRNMLSDSVLWQRPAINGFLLEYKAEQSYANLWLDWTGGERNSVVESFFIGWSGRWQRGILYGQHFGYMFHLVKIDSLAHNQNPTSISVKDNIKTVTSLGVDLAKTTIFDKLTTNVGLSASAERDRLTGEYHLPMGLIWETEAEYQGIGLKNTLYYGDSQQRMYRQYGNLLYWGDLMYKTNLYDRADLMVYFYKSNILNITLNLSLHFTDGQFYNQQILTATFDLDNFYNKSLDKSYRYIWDNWFGQR